MTVKFIWRNMFPGGYKDSEQTKEITVDNPYATTTAEIETKAALDTPNGYYLHKILFPGLTFRYTKQGKRTVSREIDNVELT